MTRLMALSQTGSPLWAHERQGGAISLLVAIGLVLLASLASFYSARSVLVDRLASQNQTQAVQARLAADAALAWGRAELQRQHASSPSPAVWGPGTSTAPCPSAFRSARWQCVALQPPALTGLPEAVAQVLAVRDLISSPHVALLLASASLKDGTSRAKSKPKFLFPLWRPPRTLTTPQQWYSMAALWLTTLRLTLRPPAGTPQTQPVFARAVLTPHAHHRPGPAWWEIPPPNKSVPGLKRRNATA